MRKMLLAMVSDIRVILVKLADRLHNMRTLDAVSPDRQERTAQETLDIYAPIANRLGMGKMRGELEDLAFKYLEPEAYRELISRSTKSGRRTKRSCRQIRADVQLKLSREGIPARVEGRLKRAYSVYQKLKRQRIPIDQVYDLMALRIITDSVKNCYAALGVIHNEWHPIPGRIKDFIAIPRPNLYQSLHTSVMGRAESRSRCRFEPRRCTASPKKASRRTGNTRKGRKGLTPDDQRIAWLRQLVEWQRELRDPGEFMSTLKVDLYPEEVYAFTPLGRVVVLPETQRRSISPMRSTRDVGHTCVGAKVNGRIVPLKTALRTATSSRSSRSRATSPARTGWRWSRRPAHATRSSTSSTRRSGERASTSGRSTWRKKLGVSGWR